MEETILLPTTLLHKEELEKLKKLNIASKRTSSTALNCNLYHIKESDLGKIINLSESGSRALALRMVSKALQLKKSDPEVKMAMLAVASGMAGWSIVEADRILRSI